MHKKIKFGISTLSSSYKLTRREILHAHHEHNKCMQRARGLSRPDENHLGIVLSVNCFVKSRLVGGMVGSRHGYREIE